MSVADVFSSSPPAAANLDASTLSSSPNLPSLNEIFSSNPQKPPFLSRRPALPNPGQARNGFTNAATLLREAPEIDIETEQITRSPSSKPGAGKSRKNKGLTPETAGIATEAPILIESSSEEKPWQKFKPKKNVRQNDQQPAIAKEKSAKQTNKAKIKAKTGTVSKHFPAKESIAKRTGERSSNGAMANKLEDQDTNSLYCSEPALRRRNNWTPPPNDPAPFGLQSDDRELHSSIDRGLRSTNVFRTLQDQYGCKDAALPAAPEQHGQADILEKRKLIELVSTRNGIEQPLEGIAPSKVVATKKKTRTITELATAPYMLPVGPELDLAGPATKESLLNYFDADGAVKALVDHQTAVMSQKKSKSKESKAPAKPKRKKKSGTMENPILLSPNSALKQSSNQDFVFGTSSQLVREESPTTLRDLQLAIQASNQADSDPFADSDSQGLWHAGARDTDGELMKVDGVQLIEGLSISSRLRKQPRYSREEFVDIDDVLKPSDVDEPAPNVLPENTHVFQSQAVASASLSRADNKLNVEAQPTTGTGHARPDFELLNDSQLASRIASYGFKPVKKRQAMIALLDQCWASKNPGVSLTQSNPISTSSAMSAAKRKQITNTEPPNPPKRRGRPRKGSTTEAAPSTEVSAPKESTAKKPRGRQKKDSPKPIEIADSDSDESLSTSSRASSPDGDRIFSSPPPVDLSISDEVDLSLTLSPTEQQASLFKHITKAVISAPRSQDPLNPSWHEKMLLYDPIILEDLAAWLNAGALSNTGYDGEVSPVDLKKWCESKSVICLWRQNQRGKERKRY